ncbi:MAG TPA: cation transporter [Flavobacteriaceae bacterium]|nr:cation transporter [Flavobacteriaceae bacterium]
MTHNIKVNNVTCDGCINTIQTELGKIEGVQNVSFDKLNLSVKVEGSVSKNTLTETLNELGYPEQK